MPCPFYWSIPYVLFDVVDRIDAFDMGQDMESYLYSIEQLNIICNHHNWILVELVLLSMFAAVNLKVILH